jgi:hypothetical protein
MSPWIQYTLARLGFFLVPLVILLWVGTGWLLSAVFASLIALALSVLFLNGLRSRLSTEITTRVTKPVKDVDSEVEDSQIESTKG